MPNTLAHVGVQGLAGRALFPGAALPWLLLGCVLPDAGWILQRLLRAVPLGLDLYELRLYAIAQSTLVLVIVLAGACAALASRPLRIFALLAVSALLHLLLDATQIKLANGVHLFAPLSWELLRFDLFWPESAASLLLTGAGLVAFVFGWIRWRADRVELCLAGSRVAAALALALVWLVLPLVLRTGPLAADNHSVRTLRAPDRTGLHAGFDRDRLEAHPDGDGLITLADERLRVAGPSRGRSGRISAEGRFLSHDTVELRAVHAHPAGGRDLPTYLGLGLGLAAWLRPGAVRLQRPASR